LQALEAIKVITGVGEVLNGKVLLYDALNQKSQIVTINPIQKSREIYQLSDQVTACSTHPKIKTDPMITEIEPKVFSEMIEKQEDLFVLDVREDWEREVAMIAPSIHIPLGEFSSSSGPELPSGISRENNIVIYCKAGVRSRMACEVLQGKGYQKLHNLSGGILKWEADGFPFA
jgi:adenylyltransferase/sulfurtransferase